MKVVLGTFACFCIENRLGLDLSTGLQQALRHYARRLESATTPVALPRFSRDQVSDGQASEFELPVEPEIEAMLMRESRAQEVPIEQLLDHAVFVYMADLDSSGGLRSLA
ncbi:MAG TPA: hypothetical protein VF770_06465 [Solirubrobacterales bacterium]